MLTRATISALVQSVGRGGSGDAGEAAVAGSALRFFGGAGGDFVALGKGVGAPTAAGADAGAGAEGLPAVQSARPFASEPTRTNLYPSPPPTAFWRAMSIPMRTVA